MKLKVKNKQYDISELLSYVKKHKPSKIEMTQEEFWWYQVVVHQRINRPPKFMGIPIKVK